MFISSYLPSSPLVHTYASMPTLTHVPPHYLPWTLNFWTFFFFFHLTWVHSYLISLIGTGLANSTTLPHIPHWSFVFFFSFFFFSVSIVEKHMNFFFLFSFFLSFGIYIHIGKYSCNVHKTLTEQASIVIWLFFQSLLKWGLYYDIPNNIWGLRYCR